MFKILRKSSRSRARIGKIETARGSFNTPVFLPCATRGVLRGIDWEEARQIGYKIMLVNAYHLYLLPGLEVLKKLGGIHNFCGWQGPILCDSGGFQIFSLNPKIGDSGARFQSHIDGREHSLTPEKVWEIGEILGVDIMMPLDDCPSGKANKKRTEQAVERTHRWLEKTIQAREKKPGVLPSVIFDPPAVSKIPASVRFQRLAAPTLSVRRPDRVGARQEANQPSPGESSRLGQKIKVDTSATPFLFGIIQGGVYRDLREKSARFVSQLYQQGKIDGIAVGGVAVGEDKKKIRQVIQGMGKILPEKAPKYLMGVGEPEDIIFAVEQGFDMFDCVLPTRLGRHGVVYAQIQKSNIKNQNDILKGKIIKQNLTRGKFRYNQEKLGETGLSRAYIHYLLKLKEMQGQRMCSQHNLTVYGKLMAELTEGIRSGRV